MSRSDIIRQRYVHTGTDGKERGEFSYKVDYPARLQKLDKDDFSKRFLDDVQSGKALPRLAEIGPQIQKLIWEQVEFRERLVNDLPSLRALVEERTLRYCNQGDFLADWTEPKYDPNLQPKILYHALENHFSAPDSKIGGATLRDITGHFEGRVIDRWLGTALPEAFPKEAKPALAALVAHVKANKTWMEPGAAPSRNIRSQVFEIFMSHFEGTEADTVPLCRAVNQCLKNLRRDLTVVKQFKAHADKIKIAYAEAYTVKHIEDYIQSRSKAGISSESVKTEIQVIERVFSDAYKSGLTTGNRITGIKVKTVVGPRGKNLKGDKAILKMGEVTKILSLYKERIAETDPMRKGDWESGACVFLTLLLLGCRPSELNPVIEYDPKRSILWINTRHEGRQIIGKTESSVRTIQLVKGGTLDIIFRNGLIESWYTGIVSERLSQQLERIYPAGTSTVKALRRTCITWRRAIGHGPEEVAAELGHSVAVATKHYLNPLEFHKIMGMEKEKAGEFWKALNKCLRYDAKAKVLKLAV